MHENEISKLIIGAAIEVHRYYGPGLVEQIYEESLCHEFKLRGIPFKRQQAVPIYYKGVKLGHDLYLDLIVFDKVIVDNKAKEKILSFDKVKLHNLFAPFQREARPVDQLSCSDAQGRNQENGEWPYRRRNLCPASVYV